VGPVVGESVLELASFPMVWLVAGAFAVAAGILGLPVRDTRLEPAERPAGGRIVHPAGLMPGVVMACSVCGLAGFNTFVPLYALDIGLGGSRAVFVTYSAIVMLIRSFGARIPDVMGPRRAAPTALGVSGLGLWLMAAWPGSAGLYAGTALFAVGQALAFPALMTIAVEAAPASERAAVVGTFTAFFDLAFGGGAIGLGAVAEVLGYRGSFGVAGAVAAGGALLLLGRAQRRRQKAAAQLRRAA
jgi:MFS family permease